MFRVPVMIIIAFCLVFAPVKWAVRAQAKASTTMAISGAATNPTHNDQIQAPEHPQMPCNHNCGGGDGLIMGLGSVAPPAPRPSVVSTIHYGRWSAAFSSLMPIPLPDPPRVTG